MAKKSNFIDVETVEDAFGNEVHVGDTIAFVKSATHDLEQGIVTKLQHDPTAMYFDGRLRAEDAWAVFVSWEAKYEWEKGKSRVRELRKIVRLG